MFKIHIQVGDFDIGDPLLAEARALVEESGLPVVIHAGSGPVPNRHTGPGPVAELLRRHPRRSPRDLLPRLRDLGLAGKVLLGSDFPNMPYPYAEQLASLARLDLGVDWLRAVCWDGPARLFDVEAAG